MPIALNFQTVLPELFLLVAVCVILLVDLLVDDRHRHVSYWLTQIALGGCVLLTARTFVVSSPVLSFGNMVVDDVLADVLKIASCVAVSAMLFYSRGYLAARGLFRGEYFVLALFALTGMMVMISANHFLTVYLGLELLSLALYAMVALDRDSRTATEAAMKYFVLGALASGILLYGMSMVYGATGALEIGRVLAELRAGGGDRTVLVFGLVFIVSGIAFKLGVVPYHMWVPDVYHGAPTAVALFIGTAPKLAAYAFTVRVLVSALQPMVADWQAMLIILALLSMIVGNVAAIAQSNIKRMLAYSTIANMGFMLLGVLAGNVDGYSAALFYTITYVLTSLAGFGVILLLTRAGFECDRIDDLKGLNTRSPWYAFVMLLVMFSLAGIPPTVGFYAKFTVILAAVDVGLVWLAVAAVVASLIGAFYYLRIVKLMYFDEAEDDSAIVARRDTRVLLSANGLALLVLGILPQPLMALCVTALGVSLRI